MTRPMCSTGTSWPKLGCWSKKLRNAMDTYDLYGACVAITGFLDALNNWYIRRSRDRFWSRIGTSSASDESKTAAYDTLYTVLHTLCLGVRTAAPHGDRDGVPGPDRRA